MTTEVVTNATGSLPPQQDVDYTPYGIVIDGTPSEHYLFTGKERDTESGLDNFGARYFASTTGRFMTPDWAERPTTVPYALFGDPQTLNLYTYVENGPVNRADEDGHGGGYLGWYTGSSNGVYDPCFDAVDQNCVAAASASISNAANTADEEAAAQQGTQTQKPCNADVCVTAPMPQIPTIPADFWEEALGKIGGLVVTAGRAATVPLIFLSYVVSPPYKSACAATDQPGCGLKAASAAKHKVPKPGVSGKEGSKDVPSWAKGARPKVGESGKDFAERLLNEKYGAGNWKGGPGSEASQIQKWGDRSFTDPPSQ